MTDIIQGSPEWHAVRCGKVTASRVVDVLAKTKSGPSASRASYMAELIIERLTGQSAERFFDTPATRWGTEQEPNARIAYEMKTGQWVDQVGFVTHPTIADAGASPDGLIGDDGLVEIKCPNSSTHIETLLSGKTPEKYVTQMRWQLICTGRQWCDFVSFDPRMPEHLRLFIGARVVRNEAIEAEVEAEVRKFLAELEVKLAALNAQLKEAA